MMSISESTLSVAICDQFAFYPFRALVAGGVTSWEDLNQAEQFVRTVLLHDYVEMDGEPMPSPEEEPEWTAEEIAVGARNVIVAFMPTLDGYEDIVHLRTGPTRELTLDLPPHLVRLAASSARTDRVDDPYLRSHMRYLRNLCLVVKRGGSVLVGGDIGQAAMWASREWPQDLLRHFDADVRQFAEQANRGDLGLIVPPLLATLIRRAGTRDRIVDALVELREEWGESRRKVWETLHALRCTSDLREANALNHELEEISQAIRASGISGSKPMEVVWQVTTEAGAKAVEALIVSGDPVLGATVPLVGRAIAGAGSLGRRLFGLGGFGLARAIGREARDYTPSVDQLRDLLSDDEKNRLGI